MTGSVSVFFISGVATGCLYAMVALGFVLIYQSSGVLNLAHGSFIALGAFATWVFAVRTEWIGFLERGGAERFVLALALAALLTGVFAAGVDRLLLSRMAHAPLFALVLVTLGLDIVIRSLLATQLPAGANAIGSPLQGDTVSIGSTTVAAADLWTIVVTVVLVVALALFLRTTAGLEIRSIAIDREAAEAVGVPVKRLITAMWALAGVLAAVAAALQLSKPGQGLDAHTAFFALRAFPAAIVGGLTSVSGAILGGLVVGLAEAYVKFFHPDFFGSNFHLVAPYAVMVGVLLLRPEGLLGTSQVQRA